MRIISSGNLLFYDSVLSLQATSSTALSATTWYRLEIKIGTGAAAAWEVNSYLGESTPPIETLSGTANLHTSNNGKCFWGKVFNRNSQTIEYYFDDMVVDDAAYTGPVKGALLYPDSDGYQTDWTIGAGSGSKWQQVDDDTLLLLHRDWQSRALMPLPSLLCSGIKPCQ